MDGFEGVEAGQGTGIDASVHLLTLPLLHSPPSSQIPGCGDLNHGYLFAEDRAESVDVVVFWVGGEAGDLVAVHVLVGDVAEHFGVVEGDGDGVGREIVIINRYKSLIYPLNLLLPPITRVNNRLRRHKLLRHHRPLLSRPGHPRPIIPNFVLNPTPDRISQLISIFRP